MDSSEALREAIANTIRQLERAELAAKQTGDAAAAQKQAALTSAKQKHAQLRQQSDAVLKETLGLMKEADVLLGELTLQAPSTTAPSLVMPATVDQAVRVLQNQRVASTDALNQLKSAAKALKRERRKWWKFW